MKWETVYAAASHALEAKAIIAWDIERHDEPLGASAAHPSAMHGKRALTVESIAGAYYRLNQEQVIEVNKPTHRTVLE